MEMEMGYPVSTPPVPSQVQMGSTPVEPMTNAQIEAERRYWHLKQCMDVLVHAQRIRQDATLMQEIRAFVRKGRDELSVLLDGLNL